jgi:Flp pilus assembly protein TadB
MNFGLVVLAAVGIGCGLLLIIVSLRTPRPSVAEALARMSTVTAPDIWPVRDRPSQLVVGLARAVGLEHLVTASVRTDLRTVDRSVDDHIARCLLSGLILGAVPPLAAAVAALDGIGVSFTVPAGMALLFAVAGLLVPAFELHQQAEKKRTDFKHALSAYLNLVGVNVAAGRGVEGALETAAATGQGPTFAAIRRCLYRAQIAGQTPWAALDTLGAEIGVDELRELAATIALAGGVGAKIRESLAAKAATLRKRGLSEIQAAANSASERMAMPVVLLVIGLIVFIGYPAISRILSGV